MGDSVMKRILVLGSNGMLGRHLVKELLSAGYDIVGSDLQDSSVENITYVKCDLTDLDQVAKLMSDVDPNQVFFCVGTYSTKDRRVLERVNAYTFHDVVRQSKPSCERFYVISSASIYGLPPTRDLPVKEEYEGFPTSNYGLSKYLLEGLAKYYENTIIIRPSNFLGRGLSEHLLPGKLVEKVRAKIGDEKIQIELFNETSVRDFIDVRDFCKIMTNLVDLENIPRVLNVSTGKGVSVREMIETLERVLDRKIETTLTGEEPEPRYRAHVQSNRKLEEFLSGHGIVLDELLSHDLKSSLSYMIDRF